MRIAVVTIAFNDLSALKKTIKSVEEQTWKDIQHIIIDGGSDDGTQSMLRTLPDRKGRIWISERDSGRYSAMNKGSAIADGELLWFMHAGDVFTDPETVAKVAQNAQENQWDWAHGFNQIVRAGKNIGMQGRMPFNLRKFALGGHPIPHQSSIFRKKFFADLGPYDTDFGLAADQLLFLKAALATEPVVIPAFLCIFDGSGAGSTRPPWKHYLDMRRARIKTSFSVTGLTALDSAITVALSINATGREFLANTIRKVKRFAEVD